MAWRGVVVQLALIFSALTISLVALVAAPVTGHDLLLLTVGALCTAMGAVITRARTDAGGADGGGGFTQRPPAMSATTKVEIPGPPPNVRRSSTAALVARDGVIAALLLASLLAISGRRP